MMRSGKDIVWVVAAWAAIVAQAAPKALCDGCDQPCHAGGACAAGPATTHQGVGHAAGCPQCAAEADDWSDETPAGPCHCQLDARHEQPLSPSRAGDPPFADGGPAHGPAAALPPAPQTLGVSREYVAASLAVPIRPPRILFGVWLD